MKFLAPKNFLGLIVNLFSINLISASSNSYYNFSIPEMLADLESLIERIGVDTLYLIFIFLLTFFIIRWIAMKIFQNHETFAGMFAFLIAFGTMYLANRVSFNFGADFVIDIIDKTGFGEEFAYASAPILLAALIFFIILKFSFRTLFLITGIFFIGMSYLAGTSAQGISMIAGIVCLIIWLILWKKHHVKALGGWAKSKIAQRNFNRDHEEALREEARRKKIIVDRAHDEAIKEEKRRQFNKDHEEAMIEEARRKSNKDYQEELRRKQDERVRKAQEQYRLEKERLAKKQAEMKKQIIKRDAKRK